MDTSLLYKTPDVMGTLSPLIISKEDDNIALGSKDNKFEMFKNSSWEIEFPIGLVSKYSLELKNKHSLKDALDKELDFIKNTDNNILINKSFYELTNSICELDFEFVNVEIINNTKIKITLYFSEGKALIINKFLVNVDGVDSSQVLYSIFVNRKLVVTNASEISLLTKGFKKYLSM